jgi:6-pyruvoyltetrahydropterin/6-carboxytetrahydropterin synthase
MYKTSISKKIIASHYLLHEKGKERINHHHQFRIQVILYGEKLDEHGFLFDIIEIKKILNKILKKFKGETLNDMDEFRGKTPSIENLSKIIWDKFIIQLKKSDISFVEIKIWEGTDNWASYKGDI